MYRIVEGGAFKGENWREMKKKTLRCILRSCDRAS